ncbi:MAG: hypothetical protein LC785_16140 [Acidobacteria bacterium]|nr:hypothetical protein [Acidobacteriota bacterium]MCA1643434.1 hypothetical protein [Acidobacteriota bacterium]
MRSTSTRRKASLVVLAAVAVFTCAAARGAAAQALPTPRVVFAGTEDYEAGGKQWTRYKLAVLNPSDFANELFAAAPDLPPCGANENPARTWVDIYNRQGRERIYGFCALTAAQDLGALWFALEKGAPPPAAIYVTITDRRNKMRVVSNVVAISTPNTGAGKTLESGNAQAQTDLSMRLALYFTGAKTDKIDLKNDKYVAAGGTMELNKSQATNCDGNTCEFNIGFIASRSGNVSGELSTYGLLQVEKGGLVGNTVYFADREKSKQGVLPLKLKMGMNKVTFTIDPYKKAAEASEANNSFSVNFNVTPTLTVIPGAKVKPNDGKP